MGTSYVAVGTTMYMITDSLTCPPKTAPRGAGQTFGLAATDRDPRPGPNAKS